MQTELTASLSALDADFRDIPGYDVVPSGTYWTVVEDVTLTTLNSCGSPKITWTLRILGPHHYGCHLRRDLVITRESLKWLKRDLYLCGFELDSLANLPDCLDNLLNLKVLVRRHPTSVHILAAHGVIGEGGHLFLHLVDREGCEFLDQQLTTKQCPVNQGEFLALIDFFVRKYQCPGPHRVYLEDGKTGAVLFSTETR